MLSGMWVLLISSVLCLTALATGLRAAQHRSTALRLMRLSAHELRAIGVALHGQAGARNDPSLALTAAGVFAVADSLHTAGPTRPPSLRDEHIDLNAAISAAVAQASAAILPGTRLWRLPSEPAPAIWADARALRHILGHVLADSIRATREGDWIEIDLRQSPSGLAITITDEGAGLITSTRDTNPRDSRGIGLRLALARQLLHAIGGQMEIEAQAGIGTSVSLLLPANRLR